MIAVSKPKKRRGTSIASVKRRIWELNKKIVRMRDKNKCQRCLKYVDGKQAETSHVVPKSHGNILRFDTQNLKVFCFSCHRWWHANPTESGDWFKHTFPERYAYIETRKNETVKWSINDFLALEEALKEELKIRLTT